MHSAHAGCRSPSTSAWLKTTNHPTNQPLAFPFSCYKAWLADTMEGQAHFYVKNEEPCDHWLLSLR